MFRALRQALYIIFLITIVLGFAKPVEAGIIASQTVGYSDILPVWQAVQELGDNLSGTAGTFTFRVSTASPRNQQFSFTAINSPLFDKTTNQIVVYGCVPPGSNINDPLKGLTFTTQGVPAGYEDVTIDFSCRNYQFISGHKYLIEIGNANYCDNCIKFAGAAYGSSVNDHFSAGGLRFGHGNRFDILHGGGRCYLPVYIWADPIVNPVSGCNIWTTPKDDLYFILKNTDPDPPSKTPLIIIPGIGGSELQAAEDIFWNQPDGHGGIYTHTYAKGEKVWVNEGEVAKPGHDDYFDILRMKPDGETAEANLELTGNLFGGAYQPTIDFFVSNGYELNKTLFVFPYDWRRDIILTAPLLDQKIADVKVQTGSQKIDLLSHSMGGLVARYYISDSTRAGNVRKLFTVGTPHLGSPKFIKSIIYGDCLYLEIGPFCLTLAPSETKHVLQNTIGGFELAPSLKYFEFYTGSNNLYPYPFKDDADIDNDGVTGGLNYQQVKQLLTNLRHNTNLFNPSENFHELDSNLVNTNGVEIHIISGSGIATLGQIIEKNILDFTGIRIPKRDILMINGDKTVPLYSSSLKDSSRNLSLSGTASNYYTNQEHGDLIKNLPSLDLIKNILNGDNNLPVGISIQPFQLTGRQLSVHSPVNMHVYDSSGNHTGLAPSGDFEINIPGSIYDTLDDAKFIFLPDSRQYTIKFESTGQGSFDFKIREFENDVNTQTALFHNIPLTTSTKAQTVLDINSPNSIVLQIDANGDGTTDSNVNPTSTLTGNAVNDLVPPKTTGNVDGSTITLTAEDNSSGVLKTEYSLDNGQTIKIYSGPFTISTPGKTSVKFKSTDNAGNEEDTQTITVEVSNSSNSGSSEGSATNPPTITSLISNLNSGTTSLPTILGAKITNLPKLIKGIEKPNIKNNVVTPLIVNQISNSQLMNIYKSAGIILILTSSGLLITFIKPITRRVSLFKNF